MVNDDLELRRSQNLRQYAITQALGRLESEHPGATPEAIVVSVCAYEEEGNIGGVLEKMPTSINGEPYTVLVVVDGGEDRTAEIARSFPGVLVIAFVSALGGGIVRDIAIGAVPPKAIQDWRYACVAERERVMPSASNSDRTTRRCAS